MALRHCGRNPAMSGILIQPIQLKFFVSLRKLNSNQYFRLFIVFQFYSQSRSKQPGKTLLPKTVNRFKMKHVVMIVKRDPEELKPNGEKSCS